MVAAVCIDTPVGCLRVVPPPSYRLEDAEWRDDGVTARVVADVATHYCPTCGQSVRRYGRGDVGIRDAPSGGVRARLLVARQRVVCETCDRLRREFLPGVSAGHRYSDRCAAWMASQFRFRSNQAIASVIGMDEKSVRLFAREAGLLSNRGRDRAEASAQCASCLRLVSELPVAIVHHDHASARETPALITLCAVCHADTGARWIKRL